MTKLINIRHTADITLEDATKRLQDGLDCPDLDAGMVFTGKGNQTVFFESFQDGRVLFATDEFGCIVAMGEVVL